MLLTQHLTQRANTQNEKGLNAAQGIKEPPFEIAYNIIRQRRSFIAALYAVRQICPTHPSSQRSRPRKT